MLVLLGLSAAVGFGVADFLGGFATRRVSALTVVVASQAWSLVAAAALVPVLGWGDMTSRDTALSVGAGLVGIAGLSALYRGLARGRMSVVAPTSAVLAAAVPIGWGLGQGERPPMLGVVGMVLSLAAVVLVTRQADRVGAGREIATSLAHGAAAGLAFGTVFVLFSETTEASEYGPLLVTRVVSVGVLTLAFLAARRPGQAGSAGRQAVVVGAGLLDFLGNVCFLGAVRLGLTSLVAALASLYPGVTVLLARAVLAESLTRVQVVGLLLALAGLACIGAAG